MSNIDALADSVERTVKGYIGERFKAFEASVVETFRKMVDALPKPKDGIDGKDGAKGDPGPKGDCAAALLVGDGPPLAAGKGGEVYIDALTGDIYRCA